MAANLTRSCRKCGETHELKENFFRTILGRDRVTKYFKNVCRNCEREASREYNKTHPEKVKASSERRMIQNPDYKKQWKDKNKKLQREYVKEYESRIHVKLKKRVSRRIRHALKSRSIDKTIKVLDFLPYTVEQLKQHLESQFEPWMNWENWGRYDAAKWDGESASTWTWNIDHKIPMANHTYSCQNDPGFVEAWKLENLRPLKAKDNIILGAKMKRIRNKRGSL